jgi:hypothetical protein
VLNILELGQDVGTEVVGFVRRLGVATEQIAQRGQGTTVRAVGITIGYCAQQGIAVI